MHDGPTSSHDQKCEELKSIRGDWLTRDSRMIFYHKLVMEMVDNFEVINFEHLPREENQMADALATLVAMF